jgi:hypothetical protein
MTTLTAPAWAPWTSYYDPAGQGPNIVTHVADDGLNMKFLLDRLAVSMDGSADSPFTGATALSGAVAVDLPETFDLLGFVLIANGHLEKTPGSQALVTCSIGLGTQSLPWPPTTASNADRNAGGGSDFQAECFTSASNPALVGAAPFPPLPPVPITITIQASRSTADDAIIIDITDFTVFLAGS